MKKIKNFILGLLALSIVSGCSDFLDLNDEGAINPGIWDNEQSAMLYINNVHKMCLPTFNGDGLNESGLANLSDETASGSNAIILGTLGVGKVTMVTGANYQPIRYINIGFQNMESSSLTGTSRNKILGHLHFFRAYQHWKMVLIHGGVSYVKTVTGYDSSGDLLNIPRHKTSECIDLLEEDLREAMAMLPASYDDKEYGRITRGAAAALLGRIMLFYASPQFNPTNDAARWERAYNANLQAKTICEEDGYGLLEVPTAVTSEWPATTDINGIFKKANKEVIFTRIYSDVDQSYHTYEQSVRSRQLTNMPSGDGAPSNCPSLLLMKAFPMKDGTVYTKEDTDATFYKDRDPRFYSTILYNGCYIPFSSGFRQWTYRVNGSVSGEGSISPSVQSPTGFYCRKMVDPTITVVAQTTTNWVEIRFAEVLLNLAECAFETNKDDVGYAAMKALRARAGIEPGDDAYYGLKAYPGSTIELVMNERFIELAFEGKRFYDLRRRNMFTHDLGTQTPKLNGQKKTAWGLRLTLKGATAAQFLEIRDGLSIDEVYSSYMTVAKRTAGPTESALNYKCYVTEDELEADQTGASAYNYNFFDISDAILTRSPAIKQNWGWPVGDFNPFE